MSDVGIFGYGSLVARESIAATLGREVAPLIPATLIGWRRRWSLVRDNTRSEKGFAPTDPTTEPFDWCLGLNLEPVDGEWVNGALIALEEGELALLDQREVRYDRVEVTAHLSRTSPTERDNARLRAFAEVVAYVARNEHFAPIPPPRSVVVASYLAACEAAFAALGADELERFRESTGPPPAPVVEATLVRDEIPPGNPRDW